MIKVIDDAKNLDKNSFIQLLKTYEEEYYDSSNPKISDETYDILIDLYETKFDTSYDEIGGVVKTKLKVKLPAFMSSLDKIKDISKLEKWITKFPPLDKKNCYQITDKLDGCAAILKYSKKNINMYTRGRKGTHGGDISHFIKYLKLPKLSDDIIIRGELVISKKNFLQYKDKMSNARNMVSGLFNSKTIGNEEIKVLKSIDFIAYHIYNIKESQDVLIEKLKDLKFQVPSPVCKNKLNFQELQNYLIERKELSLYELDGIVISYLDSNIEFPNDKNPKHIFAFKQNTSILAKVIKVEWNVSRQKLLKPIVHIEPVQLSGAIISKLSGHNARFIKENGIGVNATILIMRSGEVIPTIISCVNRVPIELPNGEWNENKVELLTNDEYSEQVEKKKIQHYFEALEIKHIAEQTVSKIYDAGYDTLYKFLSLTEDQLFNIKGFKEKSVLRILNAIQEATQNVELYKVMNASSIFPTLGEKKCKMIVEEYPNFVEDIDIDNWEELIRQIKGFKETAKIFSNNVDNFRKFLTTHNMIKIKKKIPHQMIIEFIEDGKESLFEKTVVFSGVRDKNLEKQIEQSGGRVTTTVSSKTNILIVKKIDSENITGKMQKALQLGIEILTIEQFIEKYIN